MQPFDHLHLSVRPLLDLPPEQRIQVIRSERWIGYEGAEHVIQELDVLYGRPRVSRMPGILLVGDANQGKSTILRRFCAKYPAINDPGSEHLVLPAMLLECPPIADEGRLLNAMLNALNIPYTKSCSPDTKHRRLREVFSKIGTRVLILDEAHNVLVSSPNRQRQFLVVLKYLTNTLLIPIVLCGNEDARYVLTTDPQLARRFRIIKLRKWQDREEFTVLLNSFEALLPLRKPSHLNRLRIVDEVLALSEGVLGEAAYLLTEAASAAVLSGEECITLQGIRAVDYVPPSRRRASDDLPEDRQDEQDF